MISTPELTIAFIQKHAAAAGRVLDTMHPDDVAAFLKEIPARVAAQAVAHMYPGAAALVLQQTEVNSAAAVIRHLGFAEAATILRQIDPAERSRLLEELPRRLKRDFEMSLAYPTGTVGAHMTTAIAMLAKKDRTASAIDVVKRAQRDHADVIFVVDDNKNLVGAVPVSDLLRHPATTELADLLDTSCVAVSARARLESVADLDAWHDYNRLPVANRRGEVIGTLPRKALRRGDSFDDTDSDNSGMTLVESMTDLLGASIIGLTDLLVSRNGSPEDRGDNHGR